MTDQYTSELEKQNEELRQKLATTQLELEKSQAALRKYLKGHVDSVAADLVSVQPMTAPTGQVHWIGHKAKKPLWTR
jgi:hypothetical protein